MSSTVLGKSRSCWLSPFRPGEREPSTHAGCMVTPALVQLWRHRCHVITQWWIFRFDVGPSLQGHCPGPREALWGGPFPRCLSAEKLPGLSNKRPVHVDATTCFRGCVTRPFPSHVRGHIPRVLPLTLKPCSRSYSTCRPEAAPQATPSRQHDRPAIAHRTAEVLNSARAAVTVLHVAPGLAS